MGENNERLIQVFKNINFENEYEKEGAERLLATLVRF